MATVNLGRIKPVFRGAYNNSTAYVIDDIVTSGGETFIAIAATTGNATSDGSKWTKLAAKGSDGTDVAATLANKEISFKTNAGALDGIPIGTAGQALKVNSGATGYEFGQAGGIAQVIQGTGSTEFTQSNPTNSDAYYPSSNKITAQITPSSTSSKILVQAISTIRFDNSSSDAGGFLSIKESISGGSTTHIRPHSSYNYNGGFYQSSCPGGNTRIRLNEFVLRSPNTTSQITYEVGVGGYETDGGSVKLNDDNSTGRVLLMEVTV